MREIDPSLIGESLELAQKAIDLSPTDPRGYYLLGRMYEELGEKIKSSRFIPESHRAKTGLREVERLN